MTLEGFVKQEWKMRYLFIEHCFRILSRKRPVAHKRGRQVTSHICQQCSLRSVKQFQAPQFQNKIPKEGYGEG